MTKKDMDRMVGAELEHIPKRTTEQQSELRMLYPAIRKRDLGTNGDPSRKPGDALQDAIARIRETRPDAQLEYDREFFGVG